LKTIRERLESYGSNSLSTVELLAIILWRGKSRDESLVMAERLLTKYGGLRGLMAADANVLRSEAGLGAGCTAQLQALCEVSRRVGLPQQGKKYQIKCPADAANLVMRDMCLLDHEELHVLVLDTKNRVIDRCFLYKGTVNSTVLRVAEVYRPAITRNSTGIVVVHNHPTGVSDPSVEDVEYTRLLIKAGELLEIALVDHIIIGDHCFTSLKERLRW